MSRTTRFWVGLCAAVAIAGCGEVVEVCGDDWCGDGEDSASCPRDCGAMSGGCTVGPDSCTGETLCVDGDCLAAFGRNYRFSDISLTTPETNAGEPWDALGGLPDPYLVVYVNGTVVLTTSAVQDSTRGSWAEGGTAVLNAGDELTFAIWDEDVADDDGMLSCGTESLSADVLRQRAFRCVGVDQFAGAELMIAINPN